MGEEMQRPMYFLECQCFFPFKIFSKDHDGFPESQWPARLNEALDRQGQQSLVFLTYRPLLPEDYQRFSQGHLSVSYMKSFEGADMGNEIYFIYRVSRQTR
jgi:hypothetical protein